MGYYSRKRNIRKFWENPLVNLCYVLSCLAFVAGIICLLAAFGDMISFRRNVIEYLVFGVLMIAAGVGLIILGLKINKIKKAKKQKSNTTENPNEQ